MELRDLPSVHELARDLSDLSRLPERLRILIARDAIDQARTELVDGRDANPAEDARRNAATLERSRPQAVINATGILIHTNLGRVPLHPDAVAAMSTSAAGYGNVEMDLTTGARGGRGAYLRTLLTELTGAEDAHVLGNNAGALYATLAVHAAGREVPVSRGELIEIGGSYRLPDLMAASGADLVEVGTTNRTRSRDYIQAITELTSLLLKVHPSNYQVLGFAEDAPITELRPIADEASVPLVFDIGSGLIDAAVPWLDGGPPSWLRGEPSVRQSVDTADLTLFSGDKLLGGPQAGIIVGKAALVQAIRSHPLSRAMRIAGPTLAALATTLEFYADGRAAELPIWAMTNQTVDALHARSQAVADATGGVIEQGKSMVGGGSVPGGGMASPVVSIAGGDDQYRRLLAADPPVLARRDAGRLIIDLRAVAPTHDTHIIDTLAT